MNKKKLRVCNDRRTSKEKIPGLKPHTEKSCTVKGQANRHPEEMELDRPRCLECQIKGLVFFPPVADLQAKL